MSVRSRKARRAFRSAPRRHFEAMQRRADADDRARVEAVMFGDATTWARDALVPGALRGMIRMRDDFDAPLPDDAALE